MKKQELSVLIPNYNFVCVPLVKQLVPLLQTASIRYEILVADDGSTDTNTVQKNKTIDTLPCCHYLVRSENAGRAAIRNFLVQQAQYAYLLFIDSDMTVISDQYISRYLDSSCDTVITGGVTIHGDEAHLKGNLRYRYEKAAEANHTAPERQKAPYQHLRTDNLLVRRDLMLQYPFDERLRYYGYEDVLLGKTFRQQHINIEHIDNPIGFCTFEDNAEFLEKTEEGLRTLSQFRDDLRGYSRLLTLIGNIHIPAILWLICLWHRLFGTLERRSLCGNHPSLTIFKLYRLGYFICSCG